MDTSSIQSLSTQTSTSSLTSTSQANLDKQDFLELLVAQLSHQDPLQPMDNTEFIAQLAQFSNLEQLMTVNSNLETLQLSQLSISNNQVASLIGREVEANGNSLQLTSQGASTINFDLSAEAQNVTIKITDANGKLIRTLDLGTRSAGINSYQWDGKDTNGNLAPTGTYQISMSATDGNGNAVDCSSRLKGTVTGISYDGGIPLLEVGTAKVKVGDVIAVRIPETSNNQ